ncbi:adenosylcobinamide kinase/adenosylcobinamide-phosphate guanylyltransferase [Pelomonas saccharophila]|uniref:Bifunctional adenosylcobalamin biosynthesis protein n=1 Tax=Roseateles saccharophilus TaxID=304 RepID=A0ABU1YWG7_ROSSA|nr:bifunctional adenosylcobinamide kinase/adenosylcobinamide-phosphate guanylyltransferase [Roseateles saccharophilus]MDR7272540.1 adenosylcobinamide kinase/adenosylcobinamide-phosphate guanylyltransferase [Roseateles saccharophilus]
MSAHELIVGGQRSGKSRRAEKLALAWPGRVVVIATALAADAEMRERIAHHRASRPAGFETLEAPLALSAALQQTDDAAALVVVDCLTLWLVNWLMPVSGTPDAAGWQAERTALLGLLPRLQSRVVFVSNEVGWGVSPLGREVRDYVDELGRLNQDVARRCGQLTLMVAGQAWTRPVEDASDA